MLTFLSILLVVVIVSWWVHNNNMKALEKKPLFVAVKKTVDVNHDGKIDVKDVTASVKAVSDTGKKATRAVRKTAQKITTKKKNK